MPRKNAAAVALGARGGLARKRALSPGERREIARKAAYARWDTECRIVSETEFLGMPETQERIELIDGMVIRQPSATYGHQEVLGRITFALRAWGRSSGRVVTVLQSPMDIRFGAERILQPDVAVVLDKIPRDHKGPIQRVPELCVEVMSRDRLYDRVTKRLVYARAGVRELWTVDLANELIERWTGDGFDARDEVRDRLQTRLLPGFTLDVRGLFTD